ncbi:MAG: DUF3488 and DUF4129 domain-containing transglutaminase family protein [Halobacteriales archaeon]
MRVPGQRIVTAVRSAGGSANRRPFVAGGLARWAALGSTAVLAWSYLRVLHHVVDVTGEVGPFLAVVATAAILGVVLARTLPARSGIVLGVGLLTGGFGGYLAALPGTYYAVITPRRALGDVASLLTGGSVVLLLNAGLWAITIAPGPTFLSTYLALRRRYAGAAAVGGTALAFLALTGDAARTTTLLGTVAALAVVGAGAVDRREGGAGLVMDLGLVLAAAVVLARSVDLIPGSGDGGSAVAPTLERSLIGGGEQVPVAGRVSLSPGLRFTVRAEEAAYWRVAAYDRYTGSGWVRTGEAAAYREGQPPAGPTTRVRQRVRAEERMDAMPAAWKPIEVEGVPDVTVTDAGGLRPPEPFAQGESYTVVSERPDATPATLRGAEGDPPSAIRERYLQVPASTRRALAAAAAEITDGAETTYDEAVDLRDWLREEKAYSLRPGRGGGEDIAAAFVAGEAPGYCVHFATALAVMLRIRGVPSRFVVGYAPGEREGGEWTVRGFDAHAWVEAYFAGVGWITLDPTPSRARRRATRRWLRGEAGAEEGAEGSRPAAGDGDPGTTPRDGTPASGEAPGATPTERSTRATAFDREERPTFLGTTTAPPPTTRADRAPAETPRRRGSGGRGIGGMPGDRLSVLAGVAGLLLGVRRYGLLGRAARSVRLRHQRPSESPAADVRRAFERLEGILSRRYRDREAGETPREYVSAVLPAGAERARRLLRYYEAVQYAGEVDRADADEAIRLADELAGEWL